MNDKTNDPTLVLGGTGHYGQHIVQSLLRKGIPVRVLSRDAVKARQVLGPDVGIVEGDVTAQESIAAALDGVKAVVISVSAFAPKTIRQQARIERDAVLVVLEEAERAGVARVVYISAYDVQPAAPGTRELESGAIKRDVEQALARSHLNWTVLGAPPSMELFFTLLRGNVMAVPGGGPPAMPTIAPADLGEIAAQAVLRDDLGGKRFRLAGQVLSFPQAAQCIAAATGRTVRLRKIPLTLPRIASALIRPFTPFNDTALFVHQMLQFVALLGSAPFVASELYGDHQRLLGTFDYTPTTLGMEAQRRIEEGRL